jgi:hypothetical protein
MTRLIALLSLGLLAGCADTGVVWSDYDTMPSAVERNRAMMIQNPNDLVRMRAPSGRDGNRSVDVLFKYGRGEATSSAPLTVTDANAAASPVMSGGK